MKRRVAATIAASTVIAALIAPAVPASSAESDGCTRAEYTKLADGMRKNRVERIVGFEGTVVYKYRLLRLKEFKFAQGPNQPVCFVVSMSNKLTDKGRKSLH